MKWKHLSGQTYSYPFHWYLVRVFLRWLHANGISTRTAHFQKYSNKSTLFHESQSLNLESLILKSQILPIQFPFTHENSVQVSGISYSLCEEANTFCVHWNLSVAPTSFQQVRQLQGYRAMSACASLCAYSPPISRALMLTEWRSLWKKTSASRERISPFPLSISWTLDCAWHVSCWMSKKYYQLPTDLNVQFALFIIKLMKNPGA